MWLVPTQAGVVAVACGDMIDLLDLVLFAVRNVDQHTQVAACFLDFLPEGGFDSP